MDKVKACFVYVGPIGDGGWTYQHHDGALQVQAAYGDKVELQWQESVPDGADAERVLTQMALGGCNIIFTTSFGYMDATNAVAAKFPNVMFEHATGFKRDHPNVSTYNARFYEGRAVQGTIAGRMTKSNKIGYIASFPIPEVIMGINSYYLHAKKVNPDVEVSVVWAYTWFDPAKEADAAKALIDQGVDVIAAHTDSTAPLAEAAKTPGVIGFGQAMLWSHDLRVAIVIGLTLPAVVMWANTTATIVPIVAERLKIDPTVISAPMITTIVDATGLLIFFSIASALLRG